MQCVKCSEVFTLEEASAKLYWMSEVDELVLKGLEFISAMGYETHENNGVSYIKLRSVKRFFVENFHQISRAFTPLEREAIRLYVQYEGESFNFQSILAAKTLQRYLNLIDDGSFFDIVNNCSLTSYFQPIIQASDRSIYGYEALIRGVKENGDLMFPDELFSKSERNDLNFKLDRMCRESALKTAAVKKVRQKVFINFLPTSIYDPEFCLRSTVKWAKQLEFDPKNIIFEVVETESVRDKKHLIKILDFYKKEGFSIALDDVGEGYSSLNMLVDIHPDIIKVDRNIIQNIDKESIKQSTYKALYTLAKENDIAVLAEGVETQEELRAVEDIGVDYVQGYLFGKPNAEPLRKVRKSI
ncbi:MAG: EAL domain-containing protein [Campylobacterales bacterium]|nr:EAL domain-containing protein [Campylobacterales bacterium]